MFLLTGGKGRHPERQTSNPTLLPVGCVLQSCKVFAQYHIPETLRQGLKLAIAIRNLSISIPQCCTIYIYIYIYIDVGTCWRWLPKYPSHHPYHNTPVMWVSPPQLSAKTPPRHPFCWRPRYPRWCPSSYPRPSSCPCPSSLGRSEGDAPRSRRWPDSKALFSKMIKGGKWNRNLKCTRTWRASFFCIAWVAHQAEAFSSVSDQTILEQIQDLVLESSEKHLTGFYPLVNIQKTMENHHF